MRTLEDITIDMAARTQALQIEQALFVLHAEQRDAQVEADNKKFLAGAMGSIPQCEDRSDPPPAKNPFNVYSAGRFSSL